MKAAADRCEGRPHVGRDRSLPTLGRPKGHGIFGVRGFGLWDRFAGDAADGCVGHGRYDLGGCLPQDYDATWRPEAFASCLPPRQAPAVDAAALETLPVQVVARCRPLAPQGADGDGEGCGRPLLQLRAAAEGPGGVVVQVGGPGLRPRAFCLDAFVGQDEGHDRLLERLGHVARSAVEGCSCAVLTCGAARTGKSHTLFGGRAEQAAEAGAAAPETTVADLAEEDAGVASQMARSVFRLIEAKARDGDVFVVEAAFLLVTSSGGGWEDLADLLSDEGRALRISESALTGACTCEGLRSVPLAGAADLDGLLRRGLARAAALLGGARPALAQRVLILRLESLQVDESSCQPLVRQSRLFLVDTSGEDDVTQAYAPSRQPSVMRLLGACRAADSKVVLLAHISAQAEDAEETLRTLEHVQHLVSWSAHGLPVQRSPQRGGADVRQRSSERRRPSLGEALAAASPARGGAGSRARSASAVQGLRDRNLECIRLLTAGLDAEDPAAAKRDVEAIAQRLREAEARERELRDRALLEQSSKLDEARGDMEQRLSLGFEKIHAHAFGSLGTLRDAVQAHLSTLRQAQQAARADAAALARLQAQIREAEAARRASEAEAGRLRERLASVETRARMLQEAQEDLALERAAFGEAKVALRREGDERRGQRAEAERDLSRLEAEQMVRDSEAQRLRELAASVRAALDRDGAAWQAQEAELQDTLGRLRRELQAARTAGEAAKHRAESEHEDACAELRQRARRLEEDCASSALRLEAAAQRRAKLEVEQRIATQRAEDLAVQQMKALERRREELAATLRKERDIQALMRELQEQVLEEASVEDSEEDDERGSLTWDAQAPHTAS